MPKNRGVSTVEVLIVVAILFIVVVLLLKPKDTRDGIREAVGTLPAAEVAPNAAGQFVEVVECGELKTWFAAHKNDRRIVALTGVGTGVNGYDANFIIVSEPLKASAY